MRLFRGTRARILAAAMATTLATAWLAAPGPAMAGPTVVELFTSQGCSSCPPADKLLGELAADPDLIALTFNVDYWNYLGWTDRFSKAEHSQRQHDYGMSRRWKDSLPIYTPQMVVHGAVGVVGSRRRDVAHALTALSAQRDKADVALARDGDRLAITISAENTAPEARVLLIAFSGPHEEAIGQGENRGRSVTYHNVVREITDLGPWRDAAAQFDVDIDLAMRGYAVLVQEPKGGPIFGAGQILLEPRS